PLPARFASAKRMAHGPRMVVTDLETELGLRYTYQTLRALKRLYPGVDFVFVMGADNLKSFKRWRNWREVARAVPVAVVSRPGISIAARIGMPRDWAYLNARHHPQSSTRLRQK
ncbi:MAG TPA: nicotinate-nucleotide adenylyltransferase, partial [Caulobacterales bacterium]|nr:nicotinate-nucleotide adenylyltransferase [Caulobacterales bacterium]